MSTALANIRVGVANRKIAILALVLAALVTKSTVWYKLLYKLKNLPPGPVPLPVIGNFHLLCPPNTVPGIHRDYFRLSKTFGPVYSLWYGSNYGIVLNSREAFYEALKTKQDEYANRPVLTSYEALTHGRGVAMNNGHRWRLIRTILQQTVTSKQHGIQSEELFVAETSSTIAWLKNEYEHGKGAQFNLRYMLRRDALNGIMLKLFGFRFGDQQSAEFYTVQEFIRVIFEHIAQGSPSDFMPFAKYLPNDEEKHYFSSVIVMEKYIDKIIEEHKKTLESADPANYDFVHAMLNAQKTDQEAGKETLTDVDIRVTCWDSMAGGIDTASVTTEWLLYTLANNVDIQRKAQAELDRVVGPDRLPCLNDIENLTYITALLDEIFRWKHFAPHGLPHEAAKDTTMLGYNIPKGTQVFFNYYSLHMNPDYWVKPEEFRPERFLEEEKDLLYICLHPEMFFSKPESYKFVPYGQGRRRCVGYGIGRIAIWIKIALYLHCFEWSSADGKPLDLETEILGITMVPKAQQIKAVPRPAARLCKSLQNAPGYVQR